MTDEDKKRIVSEPPPPTDEIDGEWEGGDDDEKTLVRELPESVSKSQPAPSGPAVAGTAVAPVSTPPKAAEASTPPEMKAAPPVESDDEDEEDEDQDEATVENEDDEDEEDEDEDEENEEDEDGEDEVPAATGGPIGADWLPEWAPYAVLAGLVSVSILFGLGLVGGGSGASSEEGDKAAEPAASTVKAPAKPSTHP